MAEETIDPRRELAIKRLQEKNAFWMHAVSYVVVNAMIVVVWLATGAGFFWPVFILALWGLGLVIHGYNAYRGNVYTEAQVQREMARLPKDVHAL
jgi:hypothetical protein